MFDIFILLLESFKGVIFISTPILVQEKLIHRRSKERKTCI